MERRKRESGQAIVELAVSSILVMMFMTGLLWLSGVFIRYQIARVHITALCEAASYAYDQNPNVSELWRYPPAYWRTALVVTVPYLPPVYFRALGWGHIWYSTGDRVWAYANYEYHPGSGNWVLDRGSSRLPPQAPPERSRLDCLLYEPIIRMRVPFWGERVFYINYRYITYSKWGG